MMPTTHLLSLPPLSLYIHIPWCVKKCPYCDFNSHTSSTPLPEQEYVKALLSDLAFQEPFIQGRRLHSIFIGGGTPSLFSANAIADILEGVSKHFHIDDTTEITLEANPGTAEQDKFIGFRAAGVNRLSIGVQSFDQHQLAKLGRIHGRDEALFAAQAARKAGFDNFNIDLMHGLSEQNAQQALSDLQQAIDLAPKHISWYQLTIEPNTAFYNSPPPIPNDDQLADIQTVGEQLLAASDFQQYEVSAYSRPGQQSAHNLNYWQFGDYIGIGAGAHGKITQANNHQILRQWQTRSPKNYLSKSSDYSAGSRIITHEELPLEFMMNALRLTQGVNSNLFEERTGLALSNIQSKLSSLSQKQLLNASSNNLGTTELGKRFLNEVLAEF